MTHRKTSKFKRFSCMFLTTAMLLSSFNVVFANDSWPLRESRQATNQADVNGYTSGQLADWSPETDPWAELLRSRVPLQERIDPLADTQANPLLPADKIQMLNAAGDYGNAFVYNAPYTDEFSRYHFTFWSYIDYYNYWHGSTSAYVTEEMWKTQSLADYRWRAFEFGIINIPDPTWTDACHKNGVLSIAGTFFSSNDRGQQSYKQMLEYEMIDGEKFFPVADGLVRMAQYYGFDGYFFNQEEATVAPGDSGANVAVRDISLYKEFLKQITDAGLYIQWYDAVNATTGANIAASGNIIENPRNISWLYDASVGGKITDSLFINYTYTSSGITTSQTNLNNFNAANGTNYTLYDVYFAGHEAGSTGVDGAHWAAANNDWLNNATDSNKIPRTSFAALGADFVHADLDRDMGLVSASNADWGSLSSGTFNVNANAFDFKHENDYQWMVTIREQLYWSGAQRDPRVRTTGTTGQWADVYAPASATGTTGVNYMQGLAAVLPEKSVVGGTNFYTGFNVGHGVNYYDHGTLSTAGEWSNMSLQDLIPTWQWWIDTTGTKVNIDYDYGPDVKMDPDTTRQNYTPIGGYTGGNSLVINGTLNADNNIRLYKTDLTVNTDTKVDITYNKSSATDDSKMNVSLIFADATSTVVKAEVPNANENTNGEWVTATVDLSAYAGKEIAVLGLAFDAGAATIENYQMNIGQLRVYDGSIAQPDAPTGLNVYKAFADTNEMYVKWDLETDYDKVQMYKVYVNDNYVGGKYDEIYYIKNMPAQSGTIKLVAVSPDGQESEAAEVSFNLNGAASNIAASQQDNGDLTVTWDEPAGWSGNVNVAVKSFHTDYVETDVTMDVAAGAQAVTFTGLPVNGDDIRITVTGPGADPVTLTTTFIDLEVDPYGVNDPFIQNEDGTPQAQDSIPVIGTANRLWIPMPNTRDWKYIHVYQNGTVMTFANMHSQDTSPFLVRGWSVKAGHMGGTTLTANSRVAVILEDETGNRSDVWYLRGNGTATTYNATTFTDPAVWAWVQANVDTDGDGVISEEELYNFSGTIEVPSDATNLTGLNLLAMARGLVMKNNSNITSIASGVLPQKLQTLTIQGCDNLTTVVFTGLRMLSDLTLEDCAKLATLTGLGGIGTSGTSVYNAPMYLQSLTMKGLNAFTTLTLAGLYDLKSLELDLDNLTTLTLTNMHKLPALDLSDCAVLATVTLNSLNELKNPVFSQAIVTLSITKSIYMDEIHIVNYPNLKTVTLTDMTRLEVVTGSKLRSLVTFNQPTGATMRGLTTFDIDWYKGYYASLEIDGYGDGKITIDDVDYTMDQTEDERLVKVGDDNEITLTFTPYGRFATLVYVDGVEYTDQLSADNTLVLTDVAADIDIKVVYAYVPAASIKINGSSLVTVKKGKTTDLTATILPANATDLTVTWVSANEAVATIDAEGHIVAKATGTAMITATTADGARYSIVVRVTV